MYLLYTFFLGAGLLLSAPYYLLRFRGYTATLKNRRGYLAFPRLEKSIWVHAVSVGEVKAVQRLIEKLDAAYPDHPLAISTTTPAGQQVARGNMVARGHVFYFPFDLPGAVRRTLDHLDPELVVIAETEIWPNFLRECRRRGIKVVMVNGRISDRSYSRYRMIRRWLGSVLDGYALLGMQSEADRERIESIGADRSKVAVLGNLKYDAPARKQTLDSALADVLERHRPWWIAASTTEGEEELLLDAFSRLRPLHPGLRLLMAPRHPERFDAVERLVRGRGYTCARRTRLEMETVQDVLLLDSIGELAATFQYAAVVFMGATLVRRGGHNILEPAAYARPIVFGPHMENFREISRLFLDAAAALQVQNSAELADAVGLLLSDEDRAKTLGDRARRLVEGNTGATDRVMAFLQPAGARRP